MELSDLRIFRAVVREGGVTRAAERLHRVQSNVTTRIRQIEDDLDTALFIREGKRLHFRPRGKCCLVTPTGCWRWPTRPVLPCAIRGRAASSVSAPWKAPRRCGYPAR